jgi:O-antigen ligase/Flp pilus assembly protein TadD
MQYTTYLRWGVLAGVFLVLFTPFIIASGGVIPNLFFPFITGKNFAFRILVELTLLLYVLLACIDPKYRPRASWIMWAALALVVWLGLSTITSVDPIKSFWSNFERMDGYINIIHLFAWFVITGAVLTAENLWERFMDTSIVASALMGLYAVLQLVHVLAISSQSGPRVDTTFGNATYLAVYMLFNIFITLFMLARRKGKGKLSVGLQSAYGIALVLQFVALFYTETRGAQLGVIGGLIIGAIWIAIFARGVSHKTLRRSAWYALGALAILVVGFIAIRDTSFVKNSSALNRIASISLTDPTVASRLLYIWPTAVKGIVDKPITGWGEENFNFVFNKYYQPAMYNQEQWFDRAHNQFLDFGIAGGVPALLLYAALFVLSAWAVWRSRLSVLEQAALLGLLAGYAFNNLFVFDNMVSFVYFFALLAFLHGISRKELPGWMFLSRPMGVQAFAVAAPLVAIVILGGGWYFNAAPMARAFTLVQALSSQPSPQTNLTLFTQALGNNAFPGNPIGHQEAVEQLAQFVSSNVAPSSLDPALKQQFLTLSATSLQDLMTQRKHDARLELFMGTVLSSAGANAEAVTYLQQAVTDSPKKQQILMQLGLTQIQNGQPIDAIASMRTAFEEDQSYDTARILYASAYYYAGDTKDGDQLLIDKWGTVVVDNDQLLQVYDNLKQWGRAEGIWKLRIEKSPNDAQLHLGLASTYFQAGDKADTIAELQTVAKLSPTLAAQMQSLITQIQNGTLKPQ